MGIETRIDSGRRRLLAFASVLLIGFASVSVAFTFAGADFLNAFHLTPTAVRLGVLGLAVAFVALAWEKERRFSRLADDLAAERVLSSSFRNRLDVVESLLDASDRLNAPLTSSEVVRLLLNASIEISGAVGGNVQVYSTSTGRVESSESCLPSMPPDEMPETREVEIPLEVEGQMIATLTLLLPTGDRNRERLALEVLHRLAEQAASTLRRARSMDGQRASYAFLQAAHAVKSRFLATVSHELRTPLTSIIGFTSTLEKHWDRLSEDDRREALQAVHRQSHKLWRLVERILEAARVELEGLAVEPVEHDVTRSVRNAMQSFLDTDDHRLSIDVPLEPVIAEIDPVIVEQCLWNLVDNALKFTEDTVTIGMEEDPRLIRIIVRDRGTEMDLEPIERSLDPLSRTDGDFRSGTGLGLHIVRTLMSDHGGTLSFTRGHPGLIATLSFPRYATEKTKQGARFDVELPPEVGVDRDQS